ncbi:MAG: CBS domain-containing protein [Fervidobacterium sp.]
MKVITCHSNPDFDGFASCVALKKVYPNYEIVIAGNPVQNLKEFLRFYEDYFPFLTENELKEVNEDIDEIIIVDTPGLERIGEEIKNKLSPDTKITIIDHHPDIRNSDNEDSRSKKILKLTGAATTIIVNMLKEKGVKLSKEEATLLGIAIYEDTGSFLYSSTTIEDLEAVMYLFNNGLQLNTVSEYIKFDLTIDQKIILNNLLQNARNYNIENYQITISVDETEKFVGGLSVIVSKFWYAHNVETFISIVRMGKKIFIVGRTKSPDIDLAGLMNEFGGGGHRQAASATVNMASVEEVEHKVLQLIPKYLSVGLKAKDIMSSPVRTAFSTETIEQVNKIMEITGHSGIPVVEGNKLVGIVTKKAVDKALNHGLGKRPIKSIMTSKLITAKVDTPVTQLRRLMVENDIGRIPILDENNILVGIVTRSDIIRSQNIAQSSSFTKEIRSAPSFKNLSSLINKRLQKRVVNLLRLIGFYGSETNSPVYVVGGFVRDLLLNIENYDIDIVVEGNGIEFAKYVATQLNAIVVPYEKFFTATIVFKDDFKIDIATARTEYYESPGELPQVDISTIRKDLYRRDFTINAMAIKLNPQEFGVLYDFFNCQRDLEQGVIRVLHNLSFIEDPTRMIRAVRFEQRYGFHMEEHTLYLLKKNLEENYLERVSGSRIRQEIEKILEEKNPLNAIKRMAELGMIKHIFPKTYYTTVMEEKLERLFAFIPFLRNKFNNFNHFYAISTILLEYYDKTSLENMRLKYGYPKKFIESLKFTENMILPVKSMIENKFQLSEIYKVLGKANPYVYAHISAYLTTQGQDYLKYYIDAVQNIKLEKISGKKLMEKYQIKSGPILNTILEEVFCRKLDDNNLDEEEFLDTLVVKYINKNNLSFD